MAENYEGEAGGYPAQVVLEEQTPSPNFVNTLNSLAGTPRLVDEDGNDLPTNDATGTITVTGGGGAGAFAVGNTVFVDAAEGDDTTGTRERSDKPFETLAEAIDVMEAGDLLFVRTGVYAESFVPKQLAWAISDVTRAANVVTVDTSGAHGMLAGQTVFHIGIDDEASPTNTFDGEFVIASVPTETSYTIAQFGANETHGGLVNAGGVALFYYHFEAGAHVRPAAGIAAVDFSAGAIAAHVTGGGVFTSTNLITVQSSSTAAVLLFEGRALRMRSTDDTAVACLSVSDFVTLRVRMSDSIISDTYDAVIGDCGKDLYVFAPLIMGGANTSNSSGNAVEVTPPANAGDRAVIEAGRMVSLTSKAVEIVSTGSRSGELIIRSGTIEGNTAGVDHGAGVAGTYSVDIIAGLITASNGPAVRDVATNTGTIRIHGARCESTYNNAAGYAVLKTESSSILVLDNCTLVPHATANESINSGGAARTVTCFGSKTAYAVGTNVTANGLLIDSGVK